MRDAARQGDNGQGRTFARAVPDTTAFLGELFAALGLGVALTIPDGRVLAVNERLERDFPGVFQAGTNTITFQVFNAGTSVIDRPAAAAIA